MLKTREYKVCFLLKKKKKKKKKKFIPAQIKLLSFESRQRTLFFFFFFSFLPGVDASHVYVLALALGCFYSPISTRTFRRTLTASLDSCAEIKSAPSVA